VFNAIVLNKILYALPVYFGYLTEGHKDMLRRVLKRANRMGFTCYWYDLDHLNKTSQYKLLFRRSRSERHCLHHLFTVKPRPPGAMHNAGTIFFSQTSDTNLINATLLLVHFLIMSRPNISGVCFMRMSMYFDFTFCLSVLFSLFCKHVRLSCVVLNKLTYLILFGKYRNIVSNTQYEQHCNTSAVLLILCNMNNHVFDSFFGDKKGHLACKGTRANLQGRHFNTTDKECQ